MGWYVGSGEVYITKVGTGQQWPMSHKRLSRIPGPPTPEPTHDNIDALTSNLGTKVPTPHPTAPPIEAHLEKRKKDDKEKDTQDEIHMLLHAGPDVVSTFHRTRQPHVPKKTPEPASD